jgi:rhodanese-related sulfurtransferase
LVDAGQAVLVDVRAKPMYDAGHIPGAISLPETSSPEEFTAFLNQYPTNTLILYCSSTSCSQSARVAGRLVTQFQRPSVKYMTGGYMEYQQLQAAQPSPNAP